MVAAVADTMAVVAADTMAVAEEDGIMVVADRVTTARDRDRAFMFIFVHDTSFGMRNNS